MNLRGFALFLFATTNLLGSLMLAIYKILKLIDGGRTRGSLFNINCLQRILILEKYKNEKKYKSLLILRYQLV